MLNEDIVQTLRRALILHLKSADISERGDDWKKALITYGDLIAKAELDVPARSISKHLERIGQDCGELPRLDVLVINRETRMPGKTFADWEHRVQQCISHRREYKI